jgi:hypothetical protein
MGKQASEKWRVASGKYKGRASREWLVASGEFRVL